MNVNTVTTSSGNVRPVCEFCGRKGRPVAPLEGTRRVSMWSLARGWSCAPYPDDFTHDDGSTGALYQCPACCGRLDRGEGLRPRSEPRDRRDASNT